MRGAPVAVGGVSSPTLPLRLPVVLMAVLVLALQVGAAYSERGTQGQQAVQETTFTPDVVRALQQRAAGGETGAQYNLGVLYLNGWGVRRDYRQAMTWFRKCAEQGDAGAQYNLGVMYRDRQGVSQDYGQAMAWFRKAAAQGLPAAQYDLGVMYEKGQGILQDYIEAHKWLNLAAARSNGEFQSRCAAARDTLGKAMTREQLAEARKRASEWLTAFEKRKK